MKNVLIVDDERIFLKSLAEGLSAYSAHFNVLTAENGIEAMKIIESAGVDLIVTDLKMPGMNGFEFLAMISRRHMNSPVIVMTAYGTPSIEERIRAHSVYYMEKPLDINMLAETILVFLSENSKGFIQGITLPSFAQLVSLEKKTYTLKIKSGDKDGTLYFLKGELIDAETGDSGGLDAAKIILSWDEAEIEIEGVCKRKKDNIGEPLNKLLIESLKGGD